MKNIYVPVEKTPNNKRIENLKIIFKEKYGNDSNFVVRVPGRVNIIGEHIDYCGYPVLPMALEQDILIAVRETEDHSLCIWNVSEKYEPFFSRMTTSNNITIKSDFSGNPFWYNYVLCGLKGALDHMEDNIKCGVELLIDGNIPPASGLSSSSALVSASCLALLHAHNVSLRKSDIASLCATSERYIGTQGGGMDQAIAFLGEKFCAQYISWNPLTATPVALPINAVFVVGHSLARANKAATNDYNCRVIECRLAAKILAFKSNVQNQQKIITLSEVQNILGTTLEDMIKLIDVILPNEIYYKEDICNILELSCDDLEALFFTENTKHLKSFKLRQRALHVYQEAMRVEKFREVCQTQNGNIENGNSEHTNGFNHNDYDRNVNEVLGNLMLESHLSLRDFYECSHPNLDKLVEISKKCDVNARLTGAGWGGCIVALCNKDNVDKYIDVLKREYYSKELVDQNSAFDDYVFATEPNSGAVIYKN